MTSTPSTEPRLTSLAHGGGCGCKIAPGVLRDILAGMNSFSLPPQLLVGIDTADDAAVYKLNDEQATLLRKLADLRGEQATQVGVGEAESAGLFSKLKGSFKSR